MGEIPPPPPPPNYANYPRAGYTTPGDRPPGVYFETIGEAWKIMTANLGVWVGAGFLSLLIAAAVFVPYYILIFGMTLSGNLGRDESLTGILASQAFSTITSFVPSAVVMVAVTALANMALKKIRGEEVELGDYFSGFRRFFPVAIAATLYSLSCTFGTLLLIVPGIFLSGALCFTSLLACDRNLGPVEALKTSYEAAKSNAWMLFLLLFVLYMLVYASACCAGIGLIFALPLAAIVLAMHYSYFFPAGGAPASTYPFAGR